MCNNPINNRAQTLQVFASPVSVCGAPPDTVRVYWTTGKQRRRALDVRLEAPGQNRLAAAEVVAIRHLLGVGQVFGPNRTGVNLALVVSKGAVKKMANQSSQHHALYEYGYPLLTRYSGASITVSKDRSWFPDAETMGEVVQVDGEALKGIEMLDAGGKGRVGITRHALERYREHCGTLSLDTAWVNLALRLKKGLHNIELEGKVLKHKVRKYGAAPEIWGRPDSPLHFVLRPEAGHKVLMTVFNRDPNERAAVFSPTAVNGRD
jgi:hypothetical protein